MKFDHEKLDVYRAAIDFIALAGETIEQLPKGNCHVADQLQRASTSIALNIAEGAGELSKDEKARFYRIARRSATECAAILDICRRLELMDPGNFETGHDLLVRIVSMLIRMANGAAAGTGKGTGRGRGTGT